MRSNGARISAALLVASSLGGLGGFPGGVNGMPGIRAAIL